jgi:hypothetical protein
VFDVAVPLSSSVKTSCVEKESDATVIYPNLFKKLKYALGTGRFDN